MLNGSRCDGDLPEHVMLPVVKSGDNLKCSNLLHQQPVSRIPGYDGLGHLLDLSAWEHI